MIQPKSTNSSASDASSVGRKDSGSKEAIAIYLSSVRELIAKNKFKSKIARRLKLKGRVKLNFVIATPNLITNLQVLESSGLTHIDRSALKTISGAPTIPDIPKELKRKSIPVTLVISYE